MKTKIQIKSIFGKLLFEFEKEDNTVKETVIEAKNSRADLSDADLSDAYLSGADLSRANLSGADLSDAYLSGADLSGANLYGANLSGADLSGADLSDAYLSGADLYGADLSRANLYGVKIKKIRIFSGLYKYVVYAFISEDDEKYIRLGCYIRKLSEWENDFWNNPGEFPNDGSEKSNLRLFAFETAKKWFEIIEK
jgi:hypothetical protein